VVLSTARPLLQAKQGSEEPSTPVSFLQSMARRLLERTLGRGTDRDRGWKDSGVDNWDDSWGRRHLLERSLGRGTDRDRGWKDSGVDNWDDSWGRRMLLGRGARGGNREGGWEDKGSDNWGNR
jgi:hypothetical protein